MRFTKLTLKGHVHNHPERIETAYYSWPNGVGLSEVGTIIRGFERAFVSHGGRATVAI